MYIKKHKLTEISTLLHEARLEELAESGLLSDPKLKGSRFAAILKRPEAKLDDIIRDSSQLSTLRNNGIDDDLIACIEMDVKYKGYVDRERLRAEQMKRLEDTNIPSDLEYMEIPSMSYESRECLTRFRPQTLGQAGRIAGVSPADQSALLIHLKKTGYLSHKR